MTSPTGPFLPPEIILLLAPCLVHHRKSHIAQYVLVCKQWRIFFEKLLLMTATVSFTHRANPRAHYPWLEQVARHIHHVHSIRLLGDAETNPTFASLLPKLSHLETVVITKITDSILDLLRRNASTLERIVYKATANQENMTTVATPAEYEVMVQHCPKLKHLALRPFQTDNTYLILKRSLESFPGHQLKSLEVIGGLSDQQVAWILDMLPGLTKMNLGFTGFGQLSARWLLHRLHGTDPGTGKTYSSLSFILDLDLRGCAFVASDMLDQILQSCPNLIRFHAGLMTLTQDMFEDKNHQSPPSSLMQPGFLSIFSSEPAMDNVPVAMPSPESRWPCLKLRDLRLTICEKRVFHHPSSHLEAMFLSQIAKFTHLERLDLSSKTPMGDDYQADPTALSLLVAPFSWTLQDGLFQMSTLRQLKHLALDGFRARSGQDEVRWMKNHWPRLETLQGELNDSLEKEWDLNAFIAMEWPEVQRLYGRISF
ncbi:hypothetical protein BG006_007035 [Podila minutissima]|uniref:F-box domain-containing protein n=1 Tax=Podila minutissima TaxID=64525 RepID=A0A9P5VKY3_9FUNG|nr:hypothetical protein BG006_007035 [Podila minutissima]